MYQGIKAAILAGLLFVAVAPAYGQEGNRMLLTGSGHGIIFDGKAREQAGVPKDIADYIWGMQKQLSTYRSDLHKIPELGHKEVDTHAYLLKTLKEMGYEPQGVGKSTGIMVDIAGADTSFRIGVRADFDGLPITEVDDGRPYRSTKPGQMHACGHDVHTSILLGVAKAYADGKVKPPSNLRLIFQPAEETGTGAKELVEAGVLNGVDIIIGLHSDPTREWGRVGLTSKTWSAYATGFTYEVTGKAAHGGMEVEKGKDAVLTAAYIVTQLQSIVSRNVAAADAGVVSVGLFQAGTVMNQIADKAVLSGTTRAESVEIHELIKGRMNDIAKGAQIAMGMPVKFEVIAEAPGLINNQTMFETVRETSIKMLGEKNVDVYSRPGMGGEDFSYYTEKIPGFYYWLGVANNEKAINAGLHTPQFDIDERALVIGVAMQLANIKALHERKKSGGTF
jgi:amidohydrolase